MDVKGSNQIAIVLNKKKEVSCAKVKNNEFQWLEIMNYLKIINFNENS